MNEIMRILSPISNTLDSKTFKQLKVITEAALSMTGRVTMLGLSRWSGDGGSYRTVQRFFGLLNIAWMKMNWLLCRSFLQDKDDVILLAGDEVTVTKSGKKTHGLDYFFLPFKGKLCQDCASYALA
ncbi:MAG: transposase [Ghiorsea sp.]|nr:transposase [Ghiorsea sp.]